MTQPPFRVLFVDPVLDGSGEIITTLHMGRDLQRAGSEAHYLGTPLARTLLEEDFGTRVRPIGADAQANFQAWETALCEIRPDAVVFADLPFFWLEQGTVQLGSPDALLDSLTAVDVPVFTLDHFGMAQQACNLFFGPPHLTQTPNRIPAMPQHVHRLLPCPMHDPRELPGRTGVPFRYWDAPLTRPSGEREQTRAQWLGDPDGLLILLPIPGWAVRVADAIDHPYHRLLPEFLAYYFEGLGRPVTIVAVNGQNLPACDSKSVRIVPVSTMPVEQFEALMFAADLLLTDNGLSIAMGKAVCGLQTCANLRNRWRFAELAPRLKGTMRDLMWKMERTKLGSIHPYEVFPGGTREELEMLGWFGHKSITDACATVELFGGERTRDALRALLLDPSSRRDLAARQRAYVDRLCALPTANEVLRDTMTSQRATR
ncbi:MAG: hypothetical protein KUG77_07190 [Nannocystaceae bacterium]|nr:hypothetical protein [Nannocystaceae bacterium]